MLGQLYQASDWRRVSGAPSGEETWRKADHHDFARVIHSPCFRRLQGKTQLFPSDESDFFRNRLTHSLEVAQIAEAIAVKLNHEHVFFQKQPIRPKLCATAGLMHDLGHPPFGHNGERALNEKMAKFGGFEGNAQTIRIVSRLERKIKKTRPEGGWDERLGLDLSSRTLLSALKYDQELPQAGNLGKFTKGYYSDDKTLIELAKDAVYSDWRARGTIKTIECYIMDIADDIAYSTYDLEDSFKAGFLSPIDLISCNDSLLDNVAVEVTRTSGINISAEKALKILTDLFDDIVSNEAIGEFAGDQSARDLVVAIAAYKNSSNMASSGYTRTLFTSDLVSEIVEAIQVEMDDDCPALSKAYLSEDALLKVETLKHFTYASMISSSRVQVAEYRGKQIVSEIFDALSDDKGVRLLPLDIRELYKLAPDMPQKMRVVCDFIAAMTDRYALELYARLKSTSGETIFKPL